MSEAFKRPAIRFGWEREEMERQAHIPTMCDLCGRDSLAADHGMSLCRRCLRVEDAEVGERDRRERLDAISEMYGIR